MDSNQHVRAAGWIFSLAFFPLGLGGVALGTADVVAGFHSRHWQNVPAVVLSSGLSRSFLAPSQPNIRYEYSFEGRSFVSDRLWPGKILAHMPVMSQSRSEWIVKSFPAGETVPAFVNPSDPGDVALIAGPGKAARWLAIFSFVLIAGFWSPLALRKIAKW